MPDHGWQFHVAVERWERELRPVPKAEKLLRVRGRPLLVWGRKDKRFARGGVGVLWGPELQRFSFLSAEDDRQALLLVIVAALPIAKQQEARELLVEDRVVACWFCNGRIKDTRNQRTRVLLTDAIAKTSTAGVVVRWWVRSRRRGG